MSVTPISVPSSQVSVHVVHDAFNEFHPSPEQLSGLNGSFVDLPFSIGNAQIDPQLLADALGLSSLGSQSAPADAVQLDSHNVPVNDPSLPRPPSDPPLDRSAADRDSPLEKECLDGE